MYNTIMPFKIISNDDDIAPTGSYQIKNKPKIQNIERCRSALVLVYTQLILLIIFVLLTQYSPEADASDPHNSIAPVFGGFDPDSNTIYRFLTMFQDVHVMIFVGFGFLMTFLKRYGYSAVGFNFLLAGLMIQWAILCHGFYHLDDNAKITLSITSLLKADIAAAAVLISMGAVLGQTSYVQLLVMGFIEIAVFSSNFYLGTEVFRVADAGGSIFVHVMGAYFGLGVSYVLCRNKKGSEVQNSLEGSSYTSDLFAMIGTIFLWMFWPSFNAGELVNDERHRAVINTYLALASCCVTAFAFSAMLTPNHKFDMVHIQNSTLAGGVAIGSAANMMVQPYGAVIVGVVAGALSVSGYSILTPLIDKHLNLHDTCGVHNLHGMPGVLAGLISSLMAGIATKEQYTSELYSVFPAMAPLTPAEDDEQSYEPGLARTASAQAGFQLIGLAVTLAVAGISGMITGFVIRSPLMTKIDDPNRYSDSLFWHLPEDVESIPEVTVGPSVISSSNMKPDNAAVVN